MNRNLQQEIEPAILLIDGNCNLCHGITKFVIKRDRVKTFQFTSYQSKVGQKLLQTGGMNAGHMDTFVLVEGTRLFTKSTAALRVFRRLGGLWPLLYGFIIVPKPVRNWVYDQIARRRYRWFGETDACLLPTPELRSRFLDE